MVPGRSLIPGVIPTMTPPSWDVRQRPRAGMLAIRRGDDSGGVRRHRQRGRIGFNRAPTVAAAAQWLPARRQHPRSKHAAGVSQRWQPRWCPNVVMLETDLGRQSEEGSGIILSARADLDQHNHVIAAAAKPPWASRRRKRR